MRSKRPKAGRTCLFVGQAGAGSCIRRGRAKPSTEHAIKIRQIPKSDLECDSADRTIAQTWIGEHAVRSGQSLFEDVSAKCGALGFE